MTAAWSGIYHKIFFFFFLQKVATFSSEGVWIISPPCQYKASQGFRLGDWSVERVSECVISQFNDTSTPKGSYHAKTGDNDCNVNSSRYSLRTALCESICYQAKSAQNVRQDLIPRVRHGEAAALCTPSVDYTKYILVENSQ